MPNVLVVEDDRDIRNSVLELLLDEGIGALGATTLEEARRYLATTPIAGIVLDYSLPDGTGGDLLAELADKSVTPPVVMATTAAAGCRRRSPTCSSS